MERSNPPPIRSLPRTARQHPAGILLPVPKTGTLVNPIPPVPETASAARLPPEAGQQWVFLVLPVSAEMAAFLPMRLITGPRPMGFPNPGAAPIPGARTRVPAQTSHTPPAQHKATGHHKHSPPAAVKPMPRGAVGLPAGAVVRSVQAAVLIPLAGRRRKAMPLPTA